VSGDRAFITKHSPLITEFSLAQVRWRPGAACDCLAPTWGPRWYTRGPAVPRRPTPCARIARPTCTRVLRRRPAPSRSTIHRQSTQLWAATVNVARGGTAPRKRAGTVPGAAGPESGPAAALRRRLRICYGLTV